MVPKSTVRPINSIKNKLNKKLSYLFNFFPNTHTKGNIKLGQDVENI